ncbi:hypothetical protein PR202_gb07979 [Eleusine coracana subsp. coracana]|uniref:Uncharacterized protein n=1 Tax=Eleusine coracana subsp. coracana TaxID=191504 RepID=A0AAV5EDG9_ELECO|nr:hypothetical protein PR202_gb07979 [Eleusine coracana subsp. coracana]
MNKMREFSLPRNNLSGKIPSDMFKSWPQLTLFYLHYNSFTGRIPLEIGEAKMLQRLSLFSNNLSLARFQKKSEAWQACRVPTEIGNLRALQDLELNNNQLEGELSATLTLLKELNDLSLSINKFT